MARSALFIASSAYADPELAQLPSATRDAVELGEVFSDPVIGQFAVTSLENPTAQEMRIALDDLFADAASGDLVMLYLSGHGLRTSAATCTSPRTTPSRGARCRRPSPPSCSAPCSTTAGPRGPSSSPTAVTAGRSRAAWWRARPATRRSMRRSSPSARAPAHARSSRRRARSSTPSKASGSPTRTFSRPASPRPCGTA
ncbi:MAG: hypothetical protein GEV11_00765 [Streptosporangiales bacterium]|nr:hypothetical protein [Streptosporangiales bacterium]